MIIRTLLQNRAIILLDEFDNAMDESSSIISYNILNELINNKLIIIVSHFPDVNGNILKLK
ncbi:ATP-binding cassette domain-containing protein [Spiroplasma litorale]|uniref:ATP-binding cassette domain-containing protein n=1 Tax=Spiroplasma litorale TaxID=216942 RepID=UPI0011873CB3|nr:ABC transporter ATP-binding protein [Spiroplasma litorale]